ncbi:OTU domain [Dillenia turbinata]|uniref:Ubiquitin thioesterase OTU n=1 Tax=Dillenia turbinata TaxID=194707 RepID=A0AAN8VU89_9MAGN
MLGGVVLSARPKPWSITPLTFLHGSAAAAAAAHCNYHRPTPTPLSLLLSDSNSGDWRRRQHSSACRLPSDFRGAASIWHAILPSSRFGSTRTRSLTPAMHHEPLMKGEGSWNVAWDARPARWLHRPDSVWLLFGVCACLAPLTEFDDVKLETAVPDEKIECCSSSTLINSEESNKSSSDYRVTGVLADGRCLFRAIAHGSCLRNGEEPPDEVRQRELADELRARVVDELLKRREETEWFIEGDFDTYVNRIQQPYVWGGEPELLMASHVLQTPISVFMLNRTSGSLVNIANYGQEYGEDQESPINVLFHGYGHYDLLETINNQSCNKA